MSRRYERSCGCRSFPSLSRSPSARRRTPHSATSCRTRPRSRPSTLPPSRFGARTSRSRCRLFPSASGGSSSFATASTVRSRARSRRSARRSASRASASARSRTTRSRSSSRCRRRKASETACNASRLARIEYVGHETVHVDLDGVRLLTDPLLRNRVAHLRRAARVSHSAVRGVDAVLISHAHYDHLDLPSLEKLGKKLPVGVPRGLGGLLRKRRFESVVEIEVGEKLAIGELEIRAVPAAHDRKRGPLGAAADPVGYVVSGSKSVYFAGDTDLFDGMSELGPVDVGLIP